MTTPRIAVIVQAGRSEHKFPIEILLSPPQRNWVPNYEKLAELLRWRKKSTILLSEKWGNSIYVHINILGQMCGIPLALM